MRNQLLLLIALAHVAGAMAQGTALQSRFEARAEARIEKSAHQKNTANWHLERAVAYQEQANKLYNASRYKLAFELYQQAEQELENATRKFDRVSEKAKLAEAYYRLGSVQEKTRGKSESVEAYRQMRELLPDDARAMSKLVRTKEGRASIGAIDEKKYKEMKRAARQRIIQRRKAK